MYNGIVREGATRGGRLVRVRDGVGVGVGVRGEDG